MSLLASWRFDRALKGLRASDDAALAAYGAAQWPSPETPARKAPYMALDFELDGLARSAHLLQAGWTVFEGTRLRLNEAVSIDIRSDAALDRRAVTVHGIGEGRAALGEPVGEVVARLLGALAGRIIIAHAAQIERGALAGAVRKLTGAKLPIRSICTLALERRLNPNLVGSDAYRLSASRARYGLPQYSAHDALTDAIAAAELFQAQISRLGPGVTIGELELD